MFESTGRHFQHYDLFAQIPSNQLRTHAHNSQRYADTVLI